MHSDNPFTENVPKAGSVSVSVLIAEQHRGIADGLEALIANEQGMECVGKIQTASEVENDVARLKPDVLISDFFLSGTPVFSGFPSNKWKRPRRVLWSSVEDAHLVHRAVEEGVFSCVFKSEPWEMLRNAIFFTHTGEHYFSPAIAPLMSRCPSARGAGLQCLSKRELEVFYLLSRNYPNSEIARRMELSPKTIETHRQNIKKNCAVAHETSLPNSLKNGAKTWENIIMSETKIKNSPKQKIRFIGIARHSMDYHPAPVPFQKEHLLPARIVKRREALRDMENS